MQNNHHGHIVQISMPDENHWNILLYSMILSYLSIGFIPMHIQFLSKYYRGSSHGDTHYSILYYIAGSKMLGFTLHTLGMFYSVANNTTFKVVSYNDLKIFYFLCFIWKGRILLDLGLFVVFFSKSEWITEHPLALKVEIGDDATIWIYHIYQSDSK